MVKRIALLSVMVLAFTCLGWAGEGSWTGVVSDSHCGAKHSEASEAAANCVKGCVKGGNKYVLVSGGKVYELDAQDKFASHAGKTVKVKGKMEGSKITVESVEAAS